MVLARPDIVVPVISADRKQVLARLALEASRGNMEVVMLPPRIGKIRPPALYIATVPHQASTRRCTTGEIASSASKRHPRGARALMHDRFLRGFQVR